MAAPDRAVADGRDRRRGRGPAGPGPAPAGLRQKGARGLDGHPPPHPKGNEAYSPAYLFRYVLDVPAGAKAVVLPENGGIRVFAMTAAQGDYAGTAPAGELYAQELAARPAAAGK